MPINKKIYKVISKVVILIIVILAYYFLSQKYHIGIPCPIHYFTGLYCPGCGITRMIFSLINFDFYQAFRFNPLVFILLIGFFIWKLLEILFQKKIVLNNKITYTLLIIVITFGIMRNIPLFSYLLPTVIS